MKQAKAAIIKQDRLRRGMTQLRYAKLMGVTPTTVYKWESGDRNVQRPTLLLTQMGTEELTEAGRRMTGLYGEY